MRPAPALEASRSNLMVSLLIAFDRFVNHSRRDFTLLPAPDLDASALQILVDMEEMLHLSQIMLRKVGDVEKLVVIGVVAGHRQNFVVRLTTVEHFENAQRSAVNLAAGEG